jgi:hypothetical protein
MKAHLVHGIILLFLVTAVCTGETPFHDTDSTRKHKDRDASPHRLVESPTMNFSKSGIVHLDMAGGFLISIEKEGYDIYSRASMIVGTAFFNGMLYVEGGVYQPSFFFDYFYYDAELPLTVAVRGALVSTDEVRLGLGYQYFDIDYADKLRTIDQTGRLALHNFYAGFTWNPGNNSYVINPGIGMREDGRGYFSISAGTSLSIGEHTQFILDIGSHGTEKNKAFGWFWTGVRFFDEKITWDLTTFLLIGYMLKVGIAL